VVVVVVVIPILVIIFSNEKKNLLQDCSGLNYFKKEIQIIFDLAKIAQNS